MGYKYNLPSEDVNDDSAIIVELYFDSSNKVKKSDLLYSFETAKAVVDVESDHDGYVLFSITEADKVLVGEKICEIFKTKKEYEKALKQPRKEKIIYKLTKKAAIFAKENNIDLDTLPISGLIKEKDLLKYVTRNSIKSKDKKILFGTKDIVILGSGGHAKMCIEILKNLSNYKIRGTIVENYELIDSEKNAIGCDSMLPEFFNNGLRNIIIGIGDIVSRNQRREYLFNKLRENGFEIPNLIDQTSIVEKSVIMGEGNQIIAGATLGTDCSIGDNNIINTGAIICHDTKINNNVHIAPGAIIAANVDVGNNTLIGMGVTIYRGIKIGENVVISNGQNIFTNIKDNQIIS